MATLPCLVREEVQDGWLTNDDNCDDRDHCDTGKGYPGNVGPTNPVCPLDNFFSRCLSWRYPLRTMRLLEDELTVVARRRCCRTGLPTATNLTVEHICQHQDMLYQPASLTPHKRCSPAMFVRSFPYCEILVYTSRALGSVKQESCSTPKLRFSTPSVARDEFFWQQWIMVVIIRRLDLLM